MDAVVTTRLHGLVLALRAGVPAAAVDPIAGGAKVAAQARAVGWPHVVTSDEVDDKTLRRVLDACLEPAAGKLALDCAERRGSGSSRSCGPSSSRAWRREGG